MTIRRCWPNLTLGICFSLLCLLLPPLLPYYPAAQYDPRAHVSKIIDGLQKGHIFRPPAPVYAANEGVVFLKTHKTGSSTISSILWHSLCDDTQIDARNCFLPPRERPGKTWDVRKSADWQALQRDGGGIPYSVWLHHAVYSPRLFAAVPSAKRMISIVRRPSQRFQSAWHWYNHSSFLHMDLPQFAAQQPPSGFALEPKFKYRSGLDATTEELTGIADVRSKTWRVQQTAFTELVDRVVSNRLLLLVAERFDESLVVLGALMQWRGVDRLVYFKHKVGSYVQAPKESLARLDRQQPFDLALWTLANHILDCHIHDLIQERGVNFTQHVALLREANAQLASKCSSSSQADAPLCACRRLRDNSVVVRDRWDSSTSTRQTCKN